MNYKTTILLNKFIRTLFIIALVLFPFTVMTNAAAIDTEYDQNVQEVSLTILTDDNSKSDIENKLPQTNDLSSKVPTLIGIIMILMVSSYWYRKVDKK